MRSATWVHWAWLILALGAACGDDDDAMLVADASADGGNERDGGGFIRERGEAEFGDKCERSSDCDVGLVCDPEIDVSYEVAGLPLRERSIVAPRFPSGVCTPMAAAPFDPNGAASCIPGVLASEQGCGDDGVCVPVTVATEQVVACRPGCDPSDKEPCGGRFGYACDFESRACIEGCQSDDECRLQLTDADSDGLPDGLKYDGESEATCDTKTFRCVHDGSDGGPVGSPCERLDDCDPDGLCLDPLQTFANTPFPGGYCTKLGCDQPGRECGAGAVCERLRPLRAALLTDPVCLQSCDVGEEPAADRVGVDGHGAGCREGYACHYNGGTGSKGVCVGGNYNAVTTNNVGAACDSDDDCYSPFGLGTCMVLAVGDVEAASGVCTVIDCAAPGLPEDLCGPSGECIGLNADITFCVQTCSKADACADGFACTDDDDSGSTANVCFPACFTDADCRQDAETCREVAAGAGYGSCVASSARPG